MTEQEPGPCVMVIHPGGLGDLVLLSELIASLKRARPERPLLLVCRSEFAAIVDLYGVAVDKVVGLPFQPYGWDRPSLELDAILQSLVPQFAGLRVEILVDAALRPNWLPTFLAAAIKPGAAIRCGLPGGSDGLLRALLERFGLSHWPVRSLDLPAGAHERDRYRLLVEALQLPWIRALPWSLPERWEQPALNWLRRHGLEREEYLACAPFGAASTPEKRWPMEQFAEVLHSFFRECRWPVLLMGDQTEEESLARLGSLLFDVPTARFAGRPEDLPLAAGVLSMAGAYLANDSGPMHLAQAFEVPGAAIFGGGGEWPAYAPWAPGSAGLCHPLPCFGCGWDCFLGHGLCVESIPVQKVHETLCAVRCAPTGAPYNVILENIQEPLLSLVDDASVRYREAQRDRAERLEVIVDFDRSRHESAARERELLGRLAEAEARATKMERAAGERLVVLEDVHMEAARRLDLIEEIGAQAELRRLAIEQLTTALAQSEASRLQMEQRMSPAEPPRRTEGRHWIATGADAEYFASSRLLIASWWEHSRLLPLLFCDLGLTADQREEAAAWPVHLVSAPKALAGASPRRGKAGLTHFLKEAGADWKSVAWIDADAVLLRPLPSLDDTADGYDLLCDASPVPATEAIDPIDLAVLPLDPADAYFSAGFWVSTSQRLLDAFDSFAEVLHQRGRFREGDALTAAIYATRSRVRTICGPIWHVRGSALDTVSVDGDWLGRYGQQAYVLHANRGFVVREDGQKVFNRDVLRAIQARLAERYSANLVEWKEAARAVTP